MTAAAPEPATGPEGGDARPLGWQVPAAATALAAWMVFLAWLAYFR